MRGAAVVLVWQRADLLHLLSLPQQLLGNLRDTSGISRATEILIHHGEPQEQCVMRRDTLISVPSLALYSVRAWAVGWKLLIVRLYSVPMYHSMMTQEGWRQYFSRVWQLKSCFNFSPSLQSYCSDPSLVLDLKNLIVLFADTLQVWGYWQPLFISLNSHAAHRWCLSV